MMPDVCAGFTIANHGLMRHRMESIPADATLRDISEGRERLQQFFSQPVSGFAYPFGTYSEAVMTPVRAAGHVYARTTGSVERCFPPDDPMAFHPCCHFLAPDFWKRHETARECGVFYFWGHSYIMISDAMWSEFEQRIARISDDPDARWGIVAELFA